MRTWTLMTGVAATLILSLAGGLRAAPGDADGWNARGAATYLDGQVAWWSTWPRAQRDHGTFCVSCHTAAPYALARPVLAASLQETAPSAAAQRLFDNVSTRVRKWNEVAPFYPDQTAGLPKSSESRGTEAVLNALLLASRDAHTGSLGEDTRTAFGHMWALQMKTGALDGTWAWLNFRFEPWEADSAPYYGAAMAVAAVSAAPGYAASADASPGLDRLKKYIGTRFGEQNLFNQTTMIAAAVRMDAVVSAAQRDAVGQALLPLQRADGGWSLSQFGAFARGDKTALDTASDGYATALAVLTLRLASTPAMQQASMRGLAWLRANQDATGKWRATSLNKQRDPASDPARFMNDAATAYAALALAEGGR